MTGHATFSSGPIGAGKTTLGRAVANRLDAAFIEGDDYADHTKPW
jgi:shikimate kinase